MHWAQRIFRVRYKMMRIEGQLVLGFKAFKLNRLALVKSVELL